MIENAMPIVLQYITSANKISHKVTILQEKIKIYRDDFTVGILEFRHKRRWHCFEMYTFGKN